MSWRDLVPNLLEQGSYRTQGELVEAIQARTGKAVNQATISRELTHLGARKVDGIYRLPADAGLSRRVHGVALAANGGLAVVHTDTAFASVVGQLIDDAEVEGVLGCIAGDNTVFVALDGREAYEALCALVGWSEGARRRPH